MTVFCLVQLLGDLPEEVVDPKVSKPFQVGELLETLLKEEENYCLVVRRVAFLVNKLEQLLEGGLVESFDCRVESPSVEQLFDDGHHYLGVVGGECTCEGFLVLELPKGEA